MNKKFLLAILAFLLFAGTVYAQESVSVSVYLDGEEISPDEIMAMY